MSIVFFDSAEDFRVWLKKHHASAAEIVVGFRKVGTGLPSMTWSQSVDEALCFGWIDGVRKRIDDASYQIRFTPRRVGSIWSAINVAKIAKLKAQGRMHAAGLAAYAQRSDKKTGVYSFEQEQPVGLTAAQTREFKKNKAAWRYFEAVPPGYRKQITYWVLSAKQATTQARRLGILIQACAEERRLR